MLLLTSQSGGWILNCQVNSKVCYFFFRFFSFPCISPSLRSQWDLQPLSPQINHKINSNVHLFPQYFSMFGLFIFVWFVNIGIVLILIYMAICWWNKPFVFVLVFIQYTGWCCKRVIDLWSCSPETAASKPLTLFRILLFYHYIN